MIENAMPPMSGWTAAHSGRVELNPSGEIYFYDGAGIDYHFLRVFNEDYAGTRIRLIIEAKPGPEGSGVLGINQWGGHDLGFFFSDGRVVQGETEFLKTELLPDGYVRAEAIWENTHHTVTIGSSQREHLATAYPGQNKLQWIIRKLEIDILGFEEKPDLPVAERIVYIDVGARDGIPMSWSALGPALHPVLVEPDPEEAERLRKTHSKKFKDIIVLPVGLAEAEGTRRLFMTNTLGCSSLRQPNKGILARYPIHDWFSVKKEIDVECTRYETLAASGRAPIPDVIKIDVQGLEYEVLTGFGALLHNVVGIELETHAYPIYIGQRLLSDIITYLDRYDLALRALRPQSLHGFAHECVEFNAFFTRRAGASLDRLAGGAMKVATCNRLWEL